MSSGNGLAFSVNEGIARRKHGGAVYADRNARIEIGRPLIDRPGLAGRRTCDGGEACAS